MTTRFTRANFHPRERTFRRAGSLCHIAVTLLASMGLNACDGTPSSNADPSAAPKSTSKASVSTTSSPIPMSTGSLAPSPAPGGAEIGSGWSSLDPGLVPTLATMNDSIQSVLSKRALEQIWVGREWTLRWPVAVQLKPTSEHNSWVLASTCEVRQGPGTAPEQCSFAIEIVNASTLKSLLELGDVTDEEAFRQALALEADEAQAFGAKFIFGVSSTREVNTPVSTLEEATRVKHATKGVLVGRVRVISVSLGISPSYQREGAGVTFRVAPLGDLRVEPTIANPASTNGAAITSPAR